MINQAIIRRYLNGEAGQDELQLLKAYLKKNDLSLLNEFMEQDWSDEQDWDKELPTELSVKMLNHIKRELAEAKTTRLQQRTTRRAWIAAAGILLLLGLGLWFGLARHERMTIYATGFGEWKSLTLPDGSLVKLNANSTLKCSKNWKEGAERQVWLDGEAFFQVEKKPLTGAKFQVNTKDLQVEVLGTAFNVNSRESQTDVFLEEGKIKLSMDDQEELLKPGDFIAYSTQQKHIVERRNEATAELHTSWKDGVLIIKDKSIGEILKKIEDLYGVDIKVSDPGLLSQIKTIAVPMDKLEVTLPVMERTFEARITQQGEKLTIQ